MYTKELKGFEIRINSFGEMESNLSIDKLNEFLNQNWRKRKKEKVGKSNFYLPGKIGLVPISIFHCTLAIKRRSRLVPATLNSLQEFPLVSWYNNLMLDHKPKEHTSFR